MGDEGAPIGREFNIPTTPGIVRTYEEELNYIHKISPWKYEIDPGFVPNMNVKGTFYVNEMLEKLLFEELQSCSGSPTGAVKGGFLPAVKQIANVVSREF